MVTQVPPEELDGLAAAIAERLPDWSVESAYLGLRAGFRCEYCDRPMLRSVEDYDAWQVDHVHPASRGGSDEDYRANKALACKLCNFIKRHTLIDRPTEGLSRVAVIAQYREVIAKRRQRKLEKLENTRAVLTGLGVDFES